jgi:hypothetical protein
VSELESKDPRAHKQILMVAFIEKEQKGNQDNNSFYIHGNTVILTVLQLTIS